MEVDFRSLISNTPTKDEILGWVSKYNVDINKFFNVNGKIFKENKLKDKINDLSLEERANMLSEEGMLIKRPIYIGEDFILFGFKEQEWESNILKK
nr:ArsC/Spx/MgsR family protein [Candidatus Arthromitus sp. SFB-rat-Yit]